MKCELRMVEKIRNKFSVIIKNGLVWYVYMELLVNELFLNICLKFAHQFPTAKLKKSKLFN
jgi:hypothetical protein